MADNVAVTAGSGTTIAADELTDGTLGSVKVQFVKLMDGTLDSSTKLKIAAEDAAHTTGDGGVMFLAVRKDTAAALAGTDGDYIPLIVDATGRLHVVAGSNTGVDIGDVDVTSVVPGTGATALGKAEDAGHTSGDVGVMALAVRKDTATALAGTDADYTPLIVDASGRLHVNVGTVAAGTNLIGQVAGADNTTSIYDGATALTPVRVKISGNTAGANALVAADGTKKIRVLAMILWASGTANTGYLASAATAIMGDSSAPIYLDKTGATGPSGFVLNYNPLGWCETAVNEALNLYLSAAQYVGGSLLYVKV